jgi:hypothetical protein
MRIAILLALSLILVACTPETGTSRQLEGCTVTDVFTCIVERNSDGRSFTVWLHNSADVAVLDVSLVVENAQCGLVADEGVVARIDPETAEELVFECTGLLPEAFSGELDIQYSLLSGYAGEPSRLTRGDFVAYAR